MPVPLPLSADPSSGEEFSLLGNMTQQLTLDDSPCILRLANSLFLQTGVHFHPDFLQLAQKYFKAETETVDFGQSAAVAQHINHWVETHTESESPWSPVDLQATRWSRGLADPVTIEKYFGALCWV